MTDFRESDRCIGQFRKAKKLVNAILKAGHTVSLFDCEEWTVKKSTDRVECYKALWTTDDDQIIARDADGKKLGWFWLVYGNAEDGCELIADHTANEYCDEIYKIVYPES